MLSPTVIKTVQNDVQAKRKISEGKPGENHSIVSLSDPVKEVNGIEKVKIFQVN